MTSLPAAVVAVSLTLALAACSSAGTPESPVQSTPGATGPSASSAALGHVHALGVDPGDGQLYAASHRGLFTVTDGAVARVGESTQDTMGFTVVGPGTFLGSGHPDPSVDPSAPGLLGLIRSEDAGRSWTSVSLRGRSDFHHLAVSGDTIYGWDSTSSALMASTDAGSSWEIRGSVPLASLITDPDDPQRLLAVAQSGLVRSTDGGRTWAAVKGAPALSILAADTAGTTYGVTTEGRVHLSSDDGTSWRAAGDVGGRPEAVVASAPEGQQRLVVAVSDQGIVASTDQGNTFEAVV